MKINLSKTINFLGTVLLFLLMTVYMYNTQERSVISTQLLQAVLLVVCILACFQLGSKIRLIIAWVFLLCVSIFISVIFNDSSEFWLVLLSKSFLWGGVFILGYVSCNMKKVIAWLSVLFSIIFISIYIGSLFSDYSIANKDYVLTSAYYLLCCAPFLFIVENKWISRVGLILIILFIFLSFKRSTLIVALSCCVVLLVSNIRQSKSTGLRTDKIILSRVFALAVCCIAAAGIYMIFVDKPIINTEGILAIWAERFSGGTSSRTNIYKEVLLLQENSSLKEWLFGHGYNAVMNYTSSGLSSHNDYLEILFNYGLIAEVLFLAFIFALLRKMKDIQRCNKRVYYGYLCAVTIFIIASIPSHMLTYSTYFLMLAYFLGFAHGFTDGCSISER